MSARIRSSKEELRELGEEEDSPNEYPSLASLRQEIANLPDATARDYLTKLFEL